MPILSAEHRRISGLRRGVCAAVLLLGALPGLGCSRSGDDPVEREESPAVETASPAVAAAPPAVEAPSTLIIPASTQGSYGDLRIGVGNVRRDEYIVLESGEHRRGMVAVLWLYYRDDPSKNTKLTVYIGRRVQIGKYAFRVENIRGGRGSVHLRFETAP